MFVIVYTKRLFNTSEITLYGDTQTGKPFTSYAEAYDVAVMKFSNRDDWHIQEIESLF
jgi:hypothetical protein